MNYYETREIIDGFVKMAYSIDKDEFMRLYLMAWYEARESMKPAEVSIFTSRGTVNTHTVDAEEMAEHVWNKFISSRRNLIVWWAGLDEDNQAIVAKMVEIYIREHGVE